MRGLHHRFADGSDVVHVFEAGIPGAGIIGPYLEFVIGQFDEGKMLAERDSFGRRCYRGDGTRSQAPTTSTSTDDTDLRGPLRWAATATPATA